MSEEKPLRIYADGVFDGFHIGHANMFKQCRQSFPGQKVWLIAGVCDQKDIEKFKGPTISSEEERIGMVKQCKWVDEVFPKSPWLVTEEFILQNNIDFVCHDDIPYTTADVEDAYAPAKKIGRFRATKRTEGISTTDVVSKILKNKEMYYVRNLKRGKSRGDLGIGLFDFLWLQIKMSLCPERAGKEHKQKST